MCLKYYLGAKYQLTYNANAYFKILVRAINLSHLKRINLHTSNTLTIHILLVKTDARSPKPMVKQELPFVAKSRKNRIVWSDWEEMEKPENWHKHMIKDWVNCLYHEI